MVIATLNSADTSATIRVTVIADATRKASATPRSAGRSAAAGKAKGPRRAKAAAPVIAANPPAEFDADTEPGEGAPPTAAERVAWASASVPEDENSYTPEYRAWLETQAGAEPGDEKGGAP